MTSPRSDYFATYSTVRFGREEPEESSLDVSRGGHIYGR